jgi:UDP-glucose 4-epimerase
MTRSLVTGGAGFIGSHLVEALLQRGDQVRVLDDFSSGSIDNLTAVKGEIELFEADLCDQAILEEVVKGVDFIFHQAAFVSVPLSIKNPGICFEVNVGGTYRLLDAARKAGVKRVVMASSAAVYGENTNFPLSEDLLPDPLSPYAASKQMGEVMAALFSNQLNLEVTALRYFNVFGPRQNPQSDYAAVIPIFLKTLINQNQPTIYGDGLQTRDFVYVHDVVQANLQAATSKKAPGREINICSGEEINLLSLLDLLAELFKKEIVPIYQDVRPGDIYRSLGNPELARDLIGFSPQIDIKEGLEITKAWLETTQT